MEHYIKIEPKFYMKTEPKFLEERRNDVVIQGLFRTQLNILDGSKLFRGNRQWLKAWVTATGGPGGPWPPHFFAK